MPAQVGITGGAELRYVAGRLRKAAARDLSRELRAAQRSAVRPLQGEIRASAAAMLPKRGGYAAIMARGIRVSTSVGLRAGTLRARVYAVGKKEHRDVLAVNAGRLRHPVFGRTRFSRGKPVANPWKVTSVPRGFVDRPVDRLADRILDDSAAGVERMLQSIART